jgi:hypothetical protein
LSARRELCVVHVADGVEAEALDTLARTMEVIGRTGIHQVLLAPPEAARGAVAERRALPAARAHFFGAVRALYAELRSIGRQQSVHAVHLHGISACLVGPAALRDSAFAGRVLCSPYLRWEHSAWSAALLGRLLQSRLQLLGCAAVTGSLTEAHKLSKLLNRSAELLPHCVSEAFFVAKRAVTASQVLADGRGAHALDTVTRLSVLLNGRGPRVPFAWLGAVSARERAQLEAASVEVLSAEDEATRATALSRAAAFLYFSSADYVPLAVAQAMAAAVPCLVSDTPSHRALIRHGDTGFLCVGERDFLERLIVLLREADERRRIGEAARAEAARSFTVRHFERAVLRAYGFSPEMPYVH